MASEFIWQIVDHLASLGHRRLAYISEPSHLTKAWYRKQGFIKALAANQLPFDPELVVEGGFRQRSGRLLAARLLDLKIRQPRLSRATTCLPWVQ